MGNIVGSFVSGFIKVVGDLLGAPLDFLSGKSCGSVCGSTWDLVCYIENFCIANLLKMLAVLVLLYIVLLFFYLLYKIGICHCIGKGTCKMLWACLTSCFSICKYVCMSLWFKSKNLKRMNEEHLRDIDDYYDSTTSNDDLEDTISYTHKPRSLEFRKLFSQRSRERRRIHLERSLRPRSHRIRVGISYMDSNERDPRKHHRHADALHNIKVTHTSKFVQKGNPKRIHYRKW
ncbi:uncharacterized protein [Elaeis guineensis]|uniref:Uncharacterized protein LOC105037139 n=1 Tax=Elaeis guineensis var. tenera TaxID=51953 RepID=A0A6I9QL14_ELAGV|nr:uncharacterized protein LOC105037139 [Elaeis guineensis]